MQALIILAVTLLVGTLSGALLAAIYLRWQWARFMKELSPREAGLEQKVSRMQAEWEESKLERIPEPLSPPPGNGFNLNRRAEALRRLKNGHTLDHVAAGLGFSAAEVELLDKVNRIAAVRALPSRIES